jgi:hypothetical protein
VAFDDRLDDRRGQDRCAGHAIAASGGIGLVEAIEHERQMLSRDSAPLSRTDSTTVSSFNSADIRSHRVGEGARAPVEAGGGGRSKWGTSRSVDSVSNSLLAGD